MKSIFFLLLFLGTLAISVYSAYDKVLLEDVKVLTFKKGQWTTARRSYSIPQLSCIGGSAVKKHPSVENVQCRNMGMGENDIQWKCEASLDKTLKLGQVDVLCEGYSRSSDPFILVGSCGLEYTLEYTDYYYEQQKPKPVEVVIHHTTGKPLIRYEKDYHPIFIYIICGIVVFWIILCCVYATPRRLPEIELEDPIIHPTYRGPTYIGPSSIYHTPSTTVVVDNSADAQAAGFITGLAVAGALNQQHTQTTVIQTPAQTYYDSDSDSPRRNHTFGTNGGTHTSTSYGGTKRR